MTDDRLDPDALAAFEVPDPSPDLGDRFIARLSAQPPRRARGIILAGIAAVAAAAIVVVLVRPTHAAEDGAAAPSVRTTARLGRRGVAVAEAGSRLSWRVDGDGTAHVAQPAGDVLYRVEPGGAFVVATPAGRVAVRGTCFRVALEATTATVTIYEGVVELANRHGHRQRGSRAVQGP